MFIVLHDVTSEISKIRKEGRKVMGAWKIVRAFFTLARDGGKCSSARPSRLVPENELIIIHRRGTGGRLFVP